MSTSSTLRPHRAGNFPTSIDDGERIGDSDTIVAHLIRKYALKSTIG